MGPVKNKCIGFSIVFWKCAVLTCMADFGFEEFCLMCESTFSFR